LDLQMVGSGEETPNKGPLQLTKQGAKGTRVPERR